MSILGFFTRGFARQLVKMDKSLAKSFNAIKEEMDDHRESINDNGNEIAANYEFLMRLDAKMEKLSERIDEIHMHQNNVPEAQIELGKSEQKLFLALYMSHNAIPINVIAHNLGLNEVQVRDYVSHMIDRGISIVQDYSHGVQSIRLGQEFRELHAKRNIVKIETKAQLEMPVSITA